MLVMPPTEEEEEEEAFDPLLKHSSFQELRNRSNGHGPDKTFPSGSVNLVRIHSDRPRHSHIIH